MTNQKATRSQGEATLVVVKFCARPPLVMGQWRDNCGQTVQPFANMPMPTDLPPTLKLPEGHVFADLKIRRCAADAIDLDMDLVKLICHLNGLDFDKVCENPGPVVTTILTVWYKSHLAAGGQEDALMEALRSSGQRFN